MFKKIAIAACVAFLSSSAMAADSYLYAGLDVGSTKLDDLDVSRTGAGAFLGYQFNPYIAIEGGARLLADTEVNGVDLKANQLAISAVGTIPLGQSGFSLFGRLGYNRVTVRVPNDKASENKALYGFGAAYAFTPAVQGRIEVQRPYTDVTNVSAGVSFHF
jgi:hypothetical protein